MDYNKLILEIIDNFDNFENIKKILCKNFVIQCLMKLIEVNKFNDSEYDIILEFNYNITSILENIDLQFNQNEQIKGKDLNNMDYKFINIKKGKKDFNECRYSLLYQLYDHTQRDINDNYNTDFENFKKEIDILNKYDNYFDEFLNMINFLENIKINQKFITLKYENIIAGYAILDDKINYPIILQNYQKEGDMLFEFNKKITETFGKKIMNSPHNLNEVGFDLFE